MITRKCCLFISKEDVAPDPSTPSLNVDGQDLYEVLRNYALHVVLHGRVEEEVGIQNFYIGMKNSITGDWDIYDVTVALSEPLVQIQSGRPACTIPSSS